MIQDTRIRALNSAEPREDGDYVLYWMQQAQRVRGNHALEHAIREANARSLPLLVYFGLTDDYPEANARHYTFLLEGLAEVDRDLEARNTRLVVRRCAPDKGATDLARGAVLLVTDRGYLRVQKAWRQNVAEAAGCAVFEVEADVVVPVETVSDKEEYAARTIRPKIHRLLGEYLLPLEETRVSRNPPSDPESEVDLGDVAKAVSTLKVDGSVEPVDDLKGGASEAERHLKRFVKDRVAVYAEERNDPNRDAVSNLSPYLHFGQVSPLDVALRVRNARGKGLKEGQESFLEEMIVRRELSMNFVHYNDAYDTYEGAVPEWAQKTLDEHADDAREFVYDVETWEAAETHDPYWNAAQLEMVVTGKMHNYMRMYWGKKIIEWSEDPETAFETALYLNNKYELDGRDANSFAGVAWCFGKHDRPWQRRDVFGTVRYMNANGLRRKFDADGYVRKIAEQAGREGAQGVLDL